MKWAVSRDLFIPGETEMLTLYHDSPEITEEDPEGKHHFAIHIPVKPL